MNYPDTSVIMILFILPSLFGFILIGEGVSKIMNYDNRGWVGVLIGAVFVVVIITAYFMLNTRMI
ncbi:hypothetical protein COW38_01355 [Candidatus Collierbacteria bacterium CG17_big_fil_post_rev_8_21_14_2_50_45_7]|uniref:Uncharacterized protein n=2 Tax=Candidatus Collieribacteriota TaxID=1752725 RepID=A0A2H0WZB2_9BACT|nr:MAG: hypothetical protein COT54_01585 [Candidatus Collierbacteria bacterium CG09_land_8_20_14_0_10_46_12]PIW08137.1 MAG: hypothetical protein COW38_01355 [Candidatus Collierbacteria bacterium CG17_big_fil_post_rev_8_21_14_2_50_45_7]